MPKFLFAAISSQSIGCIAFLALSFLATSLVFSSALLSQDVSHDALEIAQKQAELAYQNYVNSGDDAIDELFKNIDAFEALCSKYAGDGQHSFRLLLGKLKLKTADKDGANKLFSEIERDAELGSAARVEARFILQEINGVADRKARINALAEAMPLEATHRKLFNELQFNILQKLFQLNTWSGLGSSAPNDSKKEELDNEIAALEQEIREAGLPEEVVKLASFQRVCLAIASEDFETVYSTLKQLQPAVESPLIAPQWNALLWNKWVDHHLKQRNYSAALVAHQKFEKAATQSEDAELIVISLNQKALLYLRMGDYTSARRLLEETRFFQLQSPHLEQSMNWRINMSKALEGDREFLQARDVLREGIDFLSSSQTVNGAQAEALKIGLLNNLGINHYLTGELDRASELLDDSRAIIEKLSLGNHLIAAESMINLGWIELARKRPEDSARIFKDAAKLVSSLATENHVRFAEALTGASRAYMALGDRDRATRLIRRAEELAYQKLIVDLRAIFDPRDRIAILQETRVHPESIAWPGVFDTYMELSVPLDLPVTEQFDVLMRWKGVLNRLDSATQRKVHYESLAQVQLLEKQLSEVYFRRASVLQKKKQQQEIRAIETQLQNLRRAQSSLDSENSQLQESGDSQTVLNSLKVGSALVSIVQIRTYRQPEANQAIGTSGEFVGFVSKAGKIARVALGEVDELESAVTQWLKYIFDKNTDERNAAQRVAFLLQKPLLPFVNGLEQLAIHADGIVHLVPWGALPGVGGKDFWVEDTCFTNVIDLSPSQSNARTLSQPSILLIGNVDYGPLNDSWPPLPETLGEIHGVAEAFAKRFPRNESVSLVDIHADKQAVLSKISGQRFVHFATHGLYLKRGNNDAFGLTDATSTLDSGLVLAAQANSTSPAGQFLTASEVMALDLKQTELVVLSACETGLGKLKAGQGIDGLAYSFHSAGVDQVVSSLWKVGDLETKELMTRFYENLWQLGLKPQDALRKAQRDLFQRPEFRMPIAWAAFTVSNRNLSSK